MRFKKLSKRGYLGILVIVLSFLFLLTQLDFPFLPHQDLFRQDFESTVAISGIGFVMGMYLLSGPLGALIALIPLTTADVGGGCAGCQGPTKPPEEEEEDLGEPPEPPESLSSRLGLPQ